VKLATREFGDPGAPLLVCLHGVTSHSGRYERLARERLGAYRVVAVDLRGHGRSGWEPPWDADAHVVDLLDTVDGPAVWMGHSFGGRLVAELAERHPERVERAILLDPALHIPPVTALEQAEAARADAYFADAEAYADFRFASGTILRAPRELVVAEVEEDLVAADDAPPETPFRVHYCRSAVIGAWSVMAAPAPAWPRCPTLVVLGEESWIKVKVPRIATIASVVVPGGHTLLWDAFDETAAAIERFLETTGGNG
jgi:lipase